MANHFYHVIDETKHLTHQEVSYAEVVDAVPAGQFGARPAVATFSKDGENRKSNKIVVAAGDKGGAKNSVVKNPIRVPQRGLP